MSTTVLIIFLVVYLGMILGGLPFLQIDRTGIALLGAIALVGLGAVSPEQAAQSVHLPTLLLLFSFMVISARNPQQRSTRSSTSATGHLSSRRCWSSPHGSIATAPAFSVCPPHC